jgi:hypothetical protein
LGEIQELGKVPQVSSVNGDSQFEIVPAKKKKEKKKKKKKHDPEIIAFQLRLVPLTAFPPTTDTTTP